MEVLSRQGDSDTSARTSDFVQRCSLALYLRRLGRLCDFDSECLLLYYHYYYSSCYYYYDYYYLFIIKMDIYIYMYNII